MKEARITPPKWALDFLRAICPDELFEEIEGDLIQRFGKDVHRFGPGRARRRFAWNAIRFFRPGILMRNSFSIELINTIMLRNYLTIAFRNLAKNKVFSIINIAGLGLGLAACLLIFQFVSIHLSYDRFHDKYDRIYRVTNDRFQNGKLIQHGTIMYPTIGPTMAKDFAEVEMYTRLMPGGSLDARVGDQTFPDDNVHFADEHFLAVFSFPLLAGDVSSALRASYSVVITASLAKKLFGEDDDYSAVLGRTILSGNDPQPYKVTGVLRDIPENSHLDFDALISYSTLVAADEAADNSWRWSDFRHYLVLKPGADARALEAKFPAFSDRYFQGDKVSGSVEKFYLQPLGEAHLYSDYEYDIARTASGSAVWSLLIVSIFILVIAWINYINLTTSKAVERAKEVGLRKVMGAMKSQLVKQFIFESVLISMIAFALSLLIMKVSQSSFNEIVRDDLSLWKVLKHLDARTVAVFLAVMAAGVLLSGFYPAFVLSGYQPVTVLKGKFHGSSRGKLLRKSLVIFQFTASTVLISGTLIVSRQLSYMNDADLGVEIRDIMVIGSPRFSNWDSTFISRVENYKHELRQINGVRSAATSNRLPGTRLGRWFGFHLADKGASEHYTISFFTADHNFFETYQVDVVAGRGFTPSDHKVNWDDINTAVINQRAARLLGLATPQEAVGRELAEGQRKWTIVGVVNDFHQESLKKPMEPMVFFPTYSTYASTSLLIERSKTAEIIESARAVFEKFFPGTAFQHSFLEDRYRTQYDDDRRFGTVMSVFTMLAIVISCLGLIGLSAYTTVQRTKEIGIRKALGATVVSIIQLLSSFFMKLVILSVALAIPVTWLVMNQWLVTYPYHISLDVSHFVLPAVLIPLIAIGTISFQIWKAARSNPVNTLRYE